MAEEAEETEERSEQQKATDAKEKHAKAQDRIKEMEEADEVPTNLEDWPDDEAKYVTFGGSEGDHSYNEGPEAKLGPDSLERHEDGSVSIEGEKVDNPDDYKGDPIPGGPTDPDAPDLPGEAKKREKREAQENDEQPGSDDAA
ncbi:MAG: hypothetical protein ACR2NH_08240 [Solirubrobacteraceae bacterium]